MLRELLTAASCALVTYGIGSVSIWEETTGGIMALVMLIWGIRANTGKEQWLSMARKTLSAVGGVLVATGASTPDKVEVLLGVASSSLAVVWSIFKLPGDPTKIEEKPSDNETGPPA